MADMMRFRRRIRRIRVHKMTRVQMHSSRHQLEAMCLMRVEMLPLLAGLPLPLDGCSGHLLV